MRIEIEPGVRLFVDVGGCSHVPGEGRLDKRPTLLLLHGGPGSDHSVYKPALDSLREHFQLVYYDHRGMGRSDRRDPTEWTLDVWADDVVRLCDALGVEKPLVLGASFGAMVAMRYLARHPNHAAKVALLCTSGYVDIDAQLAVLDRRGFDEGTRTAAEAFWRNPTQEHAAAFGPVSGPLYTTSGIQPKDRAVRNYEVMFHFLEGEMQQMNLLGALTNIQTPVLVMAGADDPVAPASGSREIANAIGDAATLDILDGASHVLWADRPDCVERIRDWFLRPV